MCIESLLNLICSWPSGFLLDPLLYEVVDELVVDSFCVFSKKWCPLAYLYGNSMYRLLASLAQFIFAVCFLEGIFLSFFICLFFLLTERKKIKTNLS